MRSGRGGYYARMNVTPPSPSPTFETPEVPERSLRVYARLWQFETWLRRMVYVELRALLGDDWDATFTTARHREKDKRLTHMPGPEADALSYGQLSNLLAAIDDHWACFSSYFPPHELWRAKLQEVSQIRHRVAHFRVGHADDYYRLLQFLRDVDGGFWRFCTSYNDVQPVLPQSDDPVTSHFLSLDPLPWVEIDDKCWARVGHVDKSKVVAMTVNVTRRPWAATTARPEAAAGWYYDATLYAQGGRCLDLPRLLETSRRLQPHLGHVMLGHGSDSIRLTLPAVLGVDRVIALLRDFHGLAMNAVRHGPNPIASDPDALASQWPECILGPMDPLSYLAPDMPCTFFAAEHPAQV